MKRISFFILLFFTIISFAQDKVLTKTGHITFEASVPTYEEVKAKNEGVTCVLNTKTAEIASLALIKGFHFKLALMEEHFNENYIESDQFPKSTFRGKIENFNFNSLTSAAKEYTIKGKLELHGKTKEITIIAKIKKTENGIEIISSFQLNTNDFGIAIPSIIKSKISKDVNVQGYFLLN